MQDRVLEALFDRTVPPAQVDLALGAGPGDGFGELDQALGRVRPAVEDDVLDISSRSFGMSS